MKKTVFAAMILLASVAMANRTEEHLKAIGAASSNKQLESLNAQITKYGFHLNAIEMFGGGQAMNSGEKGGVYISYQYKNGIRSDLSCSMAFKMEKNPVTGAYDFAGVELDDSFTNFCPRAIVQLQGIATRANISEAELLEMFAK